MTRLAVLGLLTLSSALAQPITMASSADGAIFEFTGPWALRGEPIALNENRLFRHGSETPSVLREGTPDRFLAFSLVSSDGKTNAAYSYIPCLGVCSLPRPSHEIEVSRDGKRTKLTGNQFRMSRNGRFLFDTGFPNFSEGPLLRDLDTGTPQAFPRVLTRHIRHSIADNGTMLTTEAGLFAGIGDPSLYRQVLLTPFGKPSELLYEASDSRIVGAAIAADGQTVFVLTSITTGKWFYQTFYKLISIDVCTRQQKILLDMYLNVVDFSLNTTGNRLLMQTNNSLLIWDQATGWKNLLTHDEGFSESQLTDDGSTAFAITGKNRVYRIDVNTNQATQLYAPMTRYLSQQSQGTTPGSLIRFSVDAADTGNQVRVGEMTFPFVKAENRLLDVQIPWEFRKAPSESTIAEISSESSPFLLRTRLNIGDQVQPWAFTKTEFAGKFTRDYLIAANQDFSALLPDVSAEAGSVIHFWVTGLGELDRKLATGEPGPIDPLARPLEKLTCYFAEDLTKLEVADILYAPNLVGVYQVDVKIPADWQAGLYRLFCQASTGQPTGGYIPISTKR